MLVALLFMSMHFACFLLSKTMRGAPQKDSDMKIFFLILIFVLSFLSASFSSSWLLMSDQNRSIRPCFSAKHYDNTLNILMKTVMNLYACNRDIYTWSLLE